MNNDFTDIDLSLNASAMRRQLLNYFKTYLKENIKYIPANKTFFFHYYYNTSLSFLALNKGLADFYDDPMYKVNEDCWIVNKLVNEDLKRVVVPLAMIAWLTTNEWRAHKKYPKAPEDLSYGLVMDYPIPILNCTYQFLNPHSTTIIHLDMGDVDYALESTIEKIKTDFPDTTQKELDEIIPPSVRLKASY